MALTALNVVSDPYYADALAVAGVMQPEEAVFCFSADRLKARLALFTAGFPGKVSFAVKSNPSREVVDRARRGRPHPLGRRLGSRDGAGALDPAPGAFSLS